MNMRRYIVLLLSLILVGCGRGSENGKAVFNTVKNVMVQTVGDPLIIGVPVDLCAEGNCLFVIAYDQKSWLHVYDKNSGDKLGEFLKPGRGPGEAIDIASIDYLRDEGNLYLFDMVLRKTIVYHLDGVTGTASFVREIHHPAEGVIRNCHVLSNGRFLYEGYLPGYDKSTRYILYDGKIVLDSYAEYPVESEDDRLAFVLGVSKGDPNTDMFVAGTTFGAVLECFDVSESDIRPVAIHILDIPVMDTSGSGIRLMEGKKYGFSTICISDNLIYTNYLDSADPTIFRTIATFDMKGRERTKYILDKNVLRLCPGAEDGEFYGITSSPEMEFSLSCFQLN